MTLSLDFLGIDTEQISAQFGNGKVLVGEGNVLIYDGDGACYTHSAGVKTLSKALERLEKDILTVMYLTKCTSARVHLTPKGCMKNNRMLLIGRKPYQRQRKNKNKPALLEQLRDAAPYHFKDHSCIQVFSHYDIEADDACMIDAYALKHGVLVSPDKDLNLNPYIDYVIGEGKFRKLADGDTFGYIEYLEWLTPSGNKSQKVSGKGIKFFLAQLLMGDSADNVAGLAKLNDKLCGLVAAYNFLNPIMDEHEAVNAVIAAYREIGQNIAPEAEALWLLRSRDDNSYKLFNEYDLTPMNKAFLDDCYLVQKWKYTPEEYFNVYGEVYGAEEAA